VLPALAAAPLEDKPSPGNDLDALRQARRQPAQRKRRIIFNNDGDEIFLTGKMTTPEALLALRTTPLVGSHVDSIFHSNSMCFGHARYPSKVMETFLCTDDVFKQSGLTHLMKQGMEPIRVMVDFGHRHGMEVFWDMRMNDAHDAMIGSYGPLLRPKLKVDHPEYLVGKADKWPKYGPWSCVNYAVPEVRDLAYRFFEEVCQKYDIDGMELDFFRHPCFFKSVAEGGRASREELGMMTDLMRRIRRMTEREGLRRGRPILVAIRVPDSVEYCQGIGLDLERWLAEGLVDILVGTCYFECNPWEYLVELGHRYGIPVYPSLSDTRVRGETRFTRQSIESYRARAMRAWAAGADGIYLFNFFDPGAALWRELGDPAALRSMDKLYFATVRNGDPEMHLAGGRAHRRLAVLTPSDPWPLSSDKARELDLAIGDDLAWAQQAGFSPQVTCHVQVAAPRIELSLNGQRLEKPTVNGDWHDFAVPPAQLRKGVNRLAIRAPRQKQASALADSWTLVWENSQLPGYPWTKMGFAQDYVAEIRDGKLLLADRGRGPGDYAFFQTSFAIRPEDQVVVEVCMKLLSGWSSVVVENGVSSEEVMFYPDRIKAEHSGLSCPMVTTDAFHTYRMVIQQQDLKVYADGQLRIDARGRFTYPPPGGHSGVAFGAASSTEVGEALWKSVKIRNPAISLLDVVLSIRFQGARVGGER
jgi:hypothetical protein